MITRYACPIDICRWVHDFPDVPVASWQSAAAVSLADAAVREQVVREHFESHPIIEWAGEVQRQRRRAEALEAQLVVAADADTKPTGATT